MQWPRWQDIAIDEKSYVRVFIRSLTKKFVSENAKEPEF